MTRTSNMKLKPEVKEFLLDVLFVVSVSLLALAIPQLLEDLLK